MSRIQVTEKEVFTYDELTEDQKQTVLQNLYDINLSNDCSEFIIEDAKDVDLNITAWDIESYCKGDFFNDAETTANKIIANHGDECETYKTASSFLADRAKVLRTPCSVCGLIEGCHVSDCPNDDDNASEFDQQLEDLDDDFLQSLLEDYRIMLRKEFEYQGSREAIEDCIEANQYEFTADGRIA